MLVRTTRDGVCVTGSTDVDCTSGIERFVWAGDNVLWEMRGPGSASSTPAELDQAIGTGQEYGAVGYTHAGGVDRPLAAYKLGVNAAVIVPHTNWREEFGGGTYLQGSPSTAPVSWPGYSTTAWYQGQPPQEQNRVYMGTVLEGQRDASGQMYKRNRFYDPQTGQFTQTDPIGIAGGLNTYGFAAGDPVSYSDPYGLCPKERERPDGSCPGGMSHAAYNRLENLITMKIGGEAADGLLNMLENGRLVANEAMVGDETRVQAVHYLDLTPSYLRIGPGFWSEGDDAAAFTIAHDYGHVLQKEQRGFIHSNDPPLSLDDWNAITRSRGFGPGGMLQTFFNATQDDANRYACKSTIAQTDYRLKYCR